MEEGPELLHRLHLLLSTLFGEESKERERERERRRYSSSSSSGSRPRLHVSSSSPSSHSDMIDMLDMLAVKEEKDTQEKKVVVISSLYESLLKKEGIRRQQPHIYDEYERFVRKERRDYQLANLIRRRKEMKM